MSAPPSTEIAPPASPPPSPTPRAPRRWLRPTVGVVVAVVVVVAALFALGVLHFGSNAASSPYLTFSGAQSSAQGASGSVSGGPWYASLAISLVSRASILEPTQNVSGFLTDASCTYDWPHGEPANLAVPATPTSTAAGASAYWIVALKNESNGLLLETISDGSASALVTTYGGSCSNVTAYLVQFPTASVDSSSVITAVNAAGGTTFVNSHPNATELWAGVGGVSDGIIVTTPEWYVEYTSCTFPAISGETGAFFNATVGGLSGEVINHSNGTSVCSLGPPGGLSGSVSPQSPPAAARKAS